MKTAILIIVLSCALFANGLSRTQEIENLIKKLDSNFHDIRHGAEATLRIFCKKGDIKLLVKRRAISKSVEQRMRLYNVLIHLGWTPSKDLAKLQKLLELIKSPKISIRTKAMTDAIRIVNSKKHIEKFFSAIPPGKIEFRSAMLTGNVRVRDNARIKFKISNIDTRGFFINLYRFRSNIRIELSPSRRIIYIGETRLWLPAIAMINEIGDFLFIKPKESVTIERKLLNDEHVGLVKVKSTYRNRGRHFQMIKYATYNIRIKIHAWVGSIKATEALEYYSVLPEKEVHNEYISIEITDKGIVFWNHSNIAREISSEAFLIIRNSKAGEIDRSFKLKIQARKNMLLKIAHPNSKKYQYQMCVKVNGKICSLATKIKESK